MRPEMMWTAVVPRVLRPAVRSELVAAVMRGPESMGTELRPGMVWRTRVMTAVVRWSGVVWAMVWRPAVVRTVMRWRTVMWRIVRTAVFFLVIVAVVVIIPVVAVPFALLFGFALGLGFVVVRIVVVVICVVVHRVGSGHERMDVPFFLDHVLASESAGIESVPPRGFIRRRTRRGRTRRAKLAKLSAAQGTIAIAIELAEGRWCAVDLRGAEGTVLIGIEQSQQSARRTGAPRKSGTARRPIATGSATFRSTITRSATFGTATLRTAAETPRHGCAGRVEFFAGERIVVVGIEAFQQPAKHFAPRLGNLIQGNVTILIAVQFTQAIERGALWAWAAVWTLAPFGSPWPVIRLSATSLAPLFGLIG